MLKLNFLILLFLPIQSALAEPIEQALTAHGFSNVKSSAPLKLIAQSLAQLAASQTEVSSTLLDANARHLLDQNGFSDAVFWLSVLRGTQVSDHDVLTDVLPKLSHQIKPNIAGSARYVFGEEMIAVTVLVHRAAILTVIPEENPKINGTGVKFRFLGRVKAGYFQPSIWVESAAGNVERIPISLSKDREFSVDWETDSPSGDLKVELVAENVSGPRVLNIASLKFNSSVPRLPIIRVGKSNDMPPAVALQKRIERFRRQQHLEPLQLNRVLEMAAVKHAQFLSQQRILSHRGKAEGHLRHRLRSLSATPEVMSELLVKAPTPLAAFGALTDSPAHQQALRNPQMNSIGVGTVGTIYVVVLARFRSLTPKVD